MPAIQKPDFKTAKLYADGISALDVRLQTLAASAPVQKLRIKGAAAAMIGTEVVNTLCQLGVDELNRGGLGARMSAVNEAGYSTVKDITEAPLQSITNIAGISEVTARVLKTRAEKIAEEIREATYLRLSPYYRSAESDALVRELYVYLKTDALRYEAEALNRKYHNRLEKAVTNALLIKNSAGWLFASADKKTACASAVSELESYLAGDFGTSAEAIFDEEEALEKTEYEKCWNDFEQRPAAYYSALQEAAPEINLADGYTGLTEEFAREIEAVSFSDSGLKCTLRPYQTFGVKYILNGVNVLLGDEMGLGKTVQAIAAMVALRNSGKTHFMVVCPASVLINWCREVTQHSDLEHVKIHGNDMPALNRWLKNGGVAVTTYESISRFALPEDFSFAMLIADEAHYVKNPAAIRTRAMLRMKAHAERTLYMTGTPLENNVNEMCFLIGCLNKGTFDRVKKKSYISAAPQFRMDVADTYFRRTREDVLKELPELIESEEWCELNKTEREAYNRDVILKQFMQMRQVSWNIDDVSRSSKGERLLELIEMAKEQNRKVIVFSFFLNTLLKVKELLGEDCYGPVTGSVPPNKRQEIVDAFTAHEGSTVLIAQIQAGGTGLNIQAASVIVFCEPQIKPSIENQAVSRAYRMGQLRSVLVYRLLSEGTIDERIMEILNEKQTIFDSFAEESVSGAESLRQAALSTKELVEEEYKRLNAEEDN